MMPHEILYLALQLSMKFFAFSFYEHLLSESTSCFYAYAKIASILADFVAGTKAKIDLTVEIRGNSIWGLGTRLSLH